MNDHPEIHWVKSARSAGDSQNCVEVADLGSAVGVRDSKDQTGPILTFAPNEWTVFIAAAKNDELNQL